MKRGDLSFLQNQHIDKFLFMVLGLENNRYTLASIRTHYHDSESHNSVFFRLCAKRSRSKYQHSSFLFDPIDRRIKRTIVLASPSGEHADHCTTGAVE